MGSTKPTRRSDPFDEVADTRFYWCGDARSAPLAEVEAAIDSGNLAIACAGAPGSGKTAFLDRLAEQLSAAGVRFIHPDRVVSCRDACAAATPAARAWEGSKEAGSTRPQGKTAEVLVLDDVDQLSRAEMAQLRDWWHILREKRQQVALVVSCAASAVDPDSTSRRQDLCSMIDTIVALPPLTHRDIEEMIRHRLAAAGWECDRVFAQSALEKVAFYAKGTPKRLVQICSRVMTLAEEAGTFPAGPDLVKEAAHQLFLPSHLREFSRKISLGLVPVPASLGGAAGEPAPAAAAAPTPAPAPTPIVETRFERRAYVEPRAPLVIERAGASPKGPVHAGLLDAVQDHRTMRHDEATAAPPHPPRPPEHAGEDDSASLHFGMPPVVKRRRRGSVGVIMICGLAIVSGALAYALGQVDVKPVEVVQIIPLPGPLPEPVSSKDAGEAGASAPASEMTTPSPAPETAPSPQSAEPVPEDVDPPSRGAEPMPQAVDPEPVPQGVDPEADFATQVPQPAPSQDDAALEVQSEAAEAAAAAETAAETVEETAAETASQGESAQAARLPADEAREEEPAEVSSRLRIDEDGDGASASAADGETATAEGAVGANVEAESVDMAARSPALPSYGDTAPPPAAAKEKEPVPNEGRDDTDTGESNQGQGAGAAASGAAVDGASAGEEPAVSWQFDADVMRAQTLLAQIGLYRGAIDGLLGDRTLAAIHDFQRGLSMPETGELSDSLLVALEEQVAAASSEAPAKEQLQGHYDAVVDAAENLQIIDIMSECRGKDAEWVYIAAINRHVLCGGLSAETPNPLPTR